MALMDSMIHGGGGGAVESAGEEESSQSSPSSWACTLCGETDQQQEGSPSVGGDAEESFALRCNSCRRWYHPWCMGYQLDLDRSCLITASEVDIPIDPASGVPLVCQWFCDECASTVTGVVAATAARRQRPSARSNRYCGPCGRFCTGGLRGCVDAGEDYNMPPSCYREDVLG